MNDDEAPILELDPMDGDRPSQPLVPVGIEGYVCRYCGKRLGVQVRIHAPGLCCGCAHGVDENEAPDWFGPHPLKERARMQCPYRGALRAAQVTVSGVRVGRRDYTVEYVDAAIAHQLAVAASHRGHRAVVIYREALTVRKERA